MAETKSKLKVWDNIPSWAIYALEYGIEEDPILEADEEEVLRIKPDENSGVKWFTPDEALKACSEPWMIERVYRKLINKLQ